MNIHIKNDDIYVTKGSKIVFDATAQDIDSVKVISKENYIYPLLLRGIFNIEVNPRLSCIIIFSGSQSISLLARDVGFEDLRTWLSDQGWNLNESIEESLQVPLVRVDVARRKVI